MIQPEVLISKLQQHTLENLDKRGQQLKDDAVAFIQEVFETAQRQDPDAEVLAFPRPIQYLTHEMLHTVHGLARHPTAISRVIVLRYRRHFQFEQGFGKMRYVANEGLLGNYLELDDLILSDVLKIARRLGLPGRDDKGQYNMVMTSRDMADRLAFVYRG